MLGIEPAHELAHEGGIVARGDEAKARELGLAEALQEAGFDVKILSAEFATSLDMADKGNFEAYLLAWSGRADPDGNAFSFHGCKQPLNYAGYCDADTDKLLAQSRELREVADRKKVYEQIAGKVLKERPIIYLYHRNWLWASTPKLVGLRSVPDGLLRVQGLKLAAP